MSAVATRRQSPQLEGNLAYDAKARIQTGPGVPEWSWRTARFGWNGPVTVAQSVRPILIPPWLERGLSMARVLLLLGLAAVLLNVRRIPFAAFRRGATPLAMAAALGFCEPSQAQTQLPAAEMLDTLRARLTEQSDAYPTAADIPQVTLT
ncbi:MAG: hypothetical protein WCO77_12650, partial [bacterium]